MINQLINKITTGHIEKVRRFVKTKEGWLYNVDMITSSIKRDPSLSNLSTFSVRKILKRDLKMRYKKVDSIDVKVFQKDNIRKFVESSGTLMKLRNIEIQLVYIDEFKINVRKDKPYNWSPLGKRGYIKKSCNDLSYSFIVAFSRSNIYGLRPTDKTNTSMDFKWFLKEVYKI